MSAGHIADRDLTKHKGMRRGSQKRQPNRTVVLTVCSTAPGSPEHLFSRATGENRFHIHSKMPLAFPLCWHWPWRWVKLPAPRQEAATQPGVRCRCTAHHALSLKRPGLRWSAPGQQGHECVPAQPCSHASGTFLVRKREVHIKRPQGKHLREEQQQPRAA